MDDSKERKNGTMLSYVSIIINTIIQLLYTPLLIRMLGQSEYGLYSLVTSIIGYLTVLDFGFGNAVIVFTAKYRAQGKENEEKKLHGMFKIIFVILGIIASVLAIILFFFVKIIFAKTMTYTEIWKMQIMTLILSFNLLISFSFSIYNSIISAYEKFTFQKVMVIVSTILKPLVMIPLLYIGFKSIAMCMVITIINLIVLLSNYFYCKNKLKIKTKFFGFDKILFKVVFGYSVWIFFGIIVDKVNWSIDQFILGAVSGTIAVSIYSIASLINQLFVNLSTAISGVFLTKISKMVSKNASPKELTNEFIKIGRLQYYIIFLMCSSLIIFGKEFINIWAGEGFEEAYYVTLLLIIPVCIPLVQNLGLSIMQAMNKYKFKSVSSLVMAIINTVISIFFAQRWGATGAALGTCISLVVCNIIIMNIYYYKCIKLNIFEFWKSIIKMTILFIIPLTLILIIIKFTHYYGMFGIVLYSGLYIILYSIISYFCVMNKYEKKLIKEFINKFYRKGEQFCERKS